MKKIMRCIMVSEFGGPNVLQLANNSPTPKPTDRQVLIQVESAGVNPVDTYIRSGTHSIKPTLPYIPGKDGGGVVHEIGENVTRVKKGERVWFYGSDTGSYAEYCLCSEERVGYLPSNMTFEDGAMIGTPYLTSYRALVQKAQVKEGEMVMVHGATGGVGIAAVQLCKILGADVIATAGSVDGEEMLTGVGVERIYNHRKEGYMEDIESNEGKIDVILEMLANVNLNNDLKIIGQNGRVVIIGCRGSIEINPRLMMGKESTVTGCALFKSTPQQLQEGRDYVQSKLNEAFLKPILWKTLELEKAREAHTEIIENSGTKGQIVLKMNSS